MAYPGYRSSLTLDRVSTTKPQLDEGIALGLLSHIDTPQLRQILEHDEKLDDLINDLQQVKNFQVDKEMLMASNKSLAEYNLSRQPDLDTAKERLAESYEIASAKKAEFDAYKQRIDVLSSQVSLETVHALLQTEAAKTEEESEAVAEDFLDGKMDVDTFLSDFIEKKTAAHLQRIKVEKMTELLRNHQARQQYGHSGRVGMPMPNSSPY